MVGVSGWAEVVQPVISHIDIMEQPVNFSRLEEDAYRSSLPFGDDLLGAFDTILPFSNCPDRLSLPHKLNTITLHFSYPAWNAPAKVQYTSILEGRDSEWSEPTERPYVVLRDLSAGSYNFKVKARDGSRGWSLQATYSIAVRKAWWQTGLARLALVLVCAGFLIAMYRRREQRKIEIREMKQLLEAYRTVPQHSISVIEMSDDKDGFLGLINRTLEEHLSDENFGIAELCELLNISRAQLHRKLKKQTGLSTSHYIRFLRLQIALEMLRDQTLNVSEVAFAVGFSNAAYFSRVFKSQFGITPSEARTQTPG